MRKPASQGSKLASKGAYIDVSDRKMQVQLTQEAKIASDFSFIRAIFAVVGFVSALRRFRAAIPVSREAEEAAAFPTLPGNGEALATPCSWKTGRGVAAAPLPGPGRAVAVRVFHVKQRALAATPFPHGAKQFAAMFVERGGASRRWPGGRAGRRRRPVSRETKRSLPPPLPPARGG